MKNNFNPYTVPENFFEQSSARAIEKSRKRARALRYGASLILAVALILVPVCIKFGTRARIQEKEIAARELAAISFS